MDCHRSYCIVMDHIIQTTVPKGSFASLTSSCDWSFQWASWCLRSRQCHLVHWTLKCARDGQWSHQDASKRQSLAVSVHLGDRTCWQRTASAAIYSWCLFKHNDLVRSKSFTYQGDREASQVHSMQLQNAGRRLRQQRIWWPLIANSSAPRGYDSGLVQTYQRLWSWSYSSGKSRLGNRQWQLALTTGIFEAWGSWSW